MIISTCKRMATKIDKGKEIICLNATLNVFRVCNVFPRKYKEDNPGKYFYIRYIITSLITLVPFFGNLLHLYHSKNNEYRQDDLDLSYVLSMLGCYLLMIFFLMNLKTARKMYMFLSDFEEFGKSPKFDHFNNTLNNISKFHISYVILINTVLVMTSNIFKRQKCKRDNITYGYKEICGLITNTWLPFDIDYFPVKQIYILLQIFSIYYVYTPAAVLTFVLMETVMHITARLDHVNQIFVQALNGEDPAKRRKKFNFAVKYHGRVLKLEKELNITFANSMFILMVLDAAILGCGASRFMEGRSTNPLAVSIAWLIAMMVVCVSGQHLTNKSLSIGAAVYECNWYKAEVSLQRDIIFVLMRCQKPMQVKASAIGVMNHAMIFTVIQASFSYINFLTKTAAREIN